MWRLLSAGLCLAVVSCGQAEEAKKAPAGSAELTVTLPPTLPSEPAQANQQLAAAEQEPAPQAGFDTVAPSPEPKQRPEAAPEPEPAAPEADSPADVEVAVAPAEEAERSDAALPAGARNWGAYIRKARFACGRVSAVEPVERAGASPGFRYYRVECEGGGAYQATDKRGHLYFRRWQG